MSALLYSVIGSAIVAVLYGLFVAQREAQLWPWLIFGSAIVAVVCGPFIFRAGITWSFALSRQRQLASLQKRRGHLIRLKECNREYYGWLLSSILWMLAIFAGTMLLYGSIAILPFGAGLAHYVGGFVALWFASVRLGDYRALQNYPKVIERLDRTIAKLEADRRRSVQPTASGGDCEEKAP
jgi:hypothetical protein